MNLLASVTLALGLVLPHAAAGDDPAGPWRQVARPEEAGFDPAGLERARALAEEAGSAAVFVVHRGRVLAAWGDVTRGFRCHSVRKSLLSALIGIHVDAGRLDLDATLAELGIDDVQPLTDVEKRARVVDLLRARSGVYHPAAKEPADMSANRPERGSREPGTHWWYNNWDFNTLLTIYEQGTGERVFEDFDARIARPLGMEDWSPADGFYQREPCRSEHAAYAFRMSARDLARVGELFRRDGAWGDRDVVPADWVAESTRAHSSWDGGGYGFMWWVYPAGALGAAYPELAAHDAYAARGTGGQFLLVVPGAGLVFVHRADTDHGRHVDGAAVWRIAELVLAARTGEPTAEPALEDVVPVPFTDPAPALPTREVVELAPDRLARLVGEYELMPGYVVSAHLHDGALFARAPDGELELFAESDTRFFARGADLEVEFLEGAAGTVVAARVDLEGRVGEARRR